MENLSLSNSFSKSHNVSSINKVNTPIKNILRTPTHHPSPSPARGGRIGDKSRQYTPKTPIGADRFIPDRNNINIELSQYLINNDTKELENKPSTMSEMVGDMSNCRVMLYTNKAPRAPEGHSNNHKVVYSSFKSSTKKKTSRFIPSAPERILDAPDIVNDYYLNLIDWSMNNVLAVALKNEVYLWNATTASIENLVTLEDPEIITSLSWEGNYLAVGNSSGNIQLWDTIKTKRLRTLNNSADRFSCLSWNQHVLSGGCRDGKIYNNDVRIASSLISTFSGHSLEVCGLQWSPNGKMLASGGNDNTVNVWSATSLGEQSSESTSVTPLNLFTDHQAAVKAIAWCPWRAGCLATGGGTADRTIRIWNCQNGQNMYSVDAKSQVSAILWSSEYRELISSHGYSNHELIIWKYPSMNKVTELTGHTQRILGMVMSPDGTTVASLAADETLRFWECFLVDSTTKKKQQIKQGKINKENCGIRFNNNIR